MLREEERKMSQPDDIKRQVVENQKIIDDLNRKSREIKIIQEISSEINSILDLSQILNSILLSLDRIFEFKHSMLLLLEENKEELRVYASHGYKNSGIGARVKVGQGIIGVVAKRNKLMRMGNVAAQMAYTATVKAQFQAAGQSTQITENAKLPGLPNLQSQVAIPLQVKGELIGVLAVESEQANIFDERDELIIGIVANQAASAIENARLFEAERKALAEVKELNETLEKKVIERTAEVVAQKNIIEEKNKSITDSIRYAKRIQDSILPREAFVGENMPDSFFLSMPKDIVSGDFYWVNHKHGKLFFSAIDCTGHGVPGAFVSIVAHANLQRAVLLFGLDTPAEILDKLNEEVQNSFAYAGGEEHIKDGMDIALCAFDRENNKLEFAGANNPMYLIREGNLTEIKGDKQPVGHHIFSQKFSNHVFDVKPGDIIYLFSDGYADQFGGEKNKKFTYKRFKELLLSISGMPMMAQKEVLERTIREWKGSEEQVDDILLIGMRV